MRRFLLIVIAALIPFALLWIAGHEIERSGCLALACVFSGTLAFLAWFASLSDAP